VGWEKVTRVGKGGTGIKNAQLRNSGVQGGREQKQELSASQNRLVELGEEGLRTRTGDTMLSSRHQFFQGQEVLRRPVHGMTGNCAFGGSGKKRPGKGKAFCPECDQAGLLVQRGRKTFERQKGPGRAIAAIRRGHLKIIALRLQKEKGPGP